MRQAIQLASAALLALLALSLAACTQSKFEQPERTGPIGLVDTGHGQQAWLANVQEEQRSRHVGSGTRSIGRWVTEYRYHLRVQAHDPATAQPKWTKELRLLRDREGGVGAQVRILGQQGALVWVWVHDQPMALSARDGSVVADRAALEAANPAIASLLPKELKYYTMVGELVVTLADARRMRIAVPGLQAVPYQVTDEASFSQANSLGSSWNGGYPTQDFGVRHGRFDGEWIGLLSEREARDGEHDASGDHYADSADITDEGERARRTFWRARTGLNNDFTRWGGGKGGVRGYCEDQVATIENREDAELLTRSSDIEVYARNRGTDPAVHARRMRECTEGFDADKFTRITQLERVPGAGEWLQGRLLKAAAAPGTPQWVQRGYIMKPAVRPPLHLGNPDSVLVLHRTRLDAQGRLALARVDTTFTRTLWTAVLPYAELSNRWETGSHLLLFGGWAELKNGVTQRHEGLVSLDLASGQWRGWDIGKEVPINPEV